eukprot:Sspe_Gene.21340::Locus_7994_Transcript_1_1_Confidence_1.000_Length_1019::g.21340::m.21340
MDRREREEDDGMTPVVDMQFSMSVGSSNAQPISVGSQPLSPPQPPPLRAESEEQIRRQQSTLSDLTHDYDSERRPVMDQRPGALQKLYRASLQHRRKFVMSIVLLIVGCILVGSGIACIVGCDNHAHGITIIFVGALGLLPGIYGTYTFLQFARGVPGYDPKDLPEALVHV